MFSPIGRGSPRTPVLCAAASNKLLINKTAFVHVVKTAARHLDVEQKPILATYGLIFFCEAFREFHALGMHLIL